jgi:hypothetical protein
VGRPPYLEHADGPPGSNEREIALTTRLLNRGVDIRSVHCPESMARPGRPETVRRLTELGEKNAGFKDHAIARQLGLSQRTATRRVGMLMARPGAGTRFQCGVAAAKRGWI